MLVEDGTVETAAGDTALLAPGPKHRRGSRANSEDSRVTQWLDFYPAPSEATRPQEQEAAVGLEPQDHGLPPASSPESSLPPDDASLRPLPLRVPSLERRGEDANGSSSNNSNNATTTNTHAKPLTRENPKWKPLPTLPVAEQPAETEVPNTAGLHHHADPAASKREPPKKHTNKEVRIQPTVDILRFGTPPPTPDSSNDGGARACADDDVDDEEEEEGEVVAVVVSKEELKEEKASANGYDDGAAGARDDERAQARRKPAGPGGAVRHTPQERVWLHVNYRGEAPFLRAWGLDIARPADRLEGLSILRDLMQAEAEGGDERGASKKE